MSKVAINRHTDQTNAKEHDATHVRQQEAPLSAGVSSSSHPVMQLASAAGNQAMIQMMQGAVSQGSRLASGGSGESLPDGVREKMEHAFNADFSDVQVHKDSNAAASIGAQAYAQGEQLHFAPGQFSPDSQEGQKLLGHELAHVVQQREGQVASPQGKGSAINFDQGLERQADDAGARAVNGLSAHSYASQGNASHAFGSGSLVHSQSMAESSPATGAPVQASFFKSVLGGLKKAGQGFMESGGLDSLMSAGKSAGQALMGGGSFGDVLKAGASSFMQGGGLGQLAGAAAGGASTFATDSGLADKASPYLQQAQPYAQKAQPFAQQAMQHAPGLAQKAVDSGAVDFVGSKMSGFGSSMAEGGGFKGLLGKGLGFAGNLLSGFGKKKTT